MNAKADDFRSKEYTRYRHRVELKDIEDETDIPRWRQFTATLGHMLAFCTTTLENILTNVLMADNTKLKEKNY
jgi:hypothetical protein